MNIFLATILALFFIGAFSVILFALKQPKEYKGDGKVPNATDKSTENV